MAKRNNKNRDKDIAFQIEKQLKWEYAQQRKKQKRSLIAIIVCSIIVVGLVVTMAMTQVVLPQMNKDSESPSPTETSEDTSSETSSVESTTDIPDNAGSVTLNGDEQPKYTPGDWDISADGGKVGVKVLEEGTGETVTSLNQKLSLKYSGWRAKDGKNFDASYLRGNDNTLDSPLSGLIKGWNPVLGHKVGSKIVLYIPQELAYGHEVQEDEQTPGGDLVFYLQIEKIIDDNSATEETPSE